LPFVPEKNIGKALISVEDLRQWSQTVVRVPVVVREDLHGSTRIDLLSDFLHKKYIHSYNFYLSGSINKFLNFCIAYFPCWFLKMAIKFSHSHFLNTNLYSTKCVSILVFQTVDRIIFGTVVISLCPPANCYDCFPAAPNAVLYYAQ